MKSAVTFEHVSKCFHLEPERPRSLQERFVRAVRRRRSAAENICVLRDISFDLPAGASLGVVGQNGVGKSTLLKLCARVIDPTSGLVRVNGRVSALLELGVGFHPELTGRENVFLYGSLVGLPRAVMQRRFDEIVAFSEIERFIDMPVKVYSSGMYLRLAFSVAIHVESDVLLVDEVFAVGDASFQHKCIERIQVLQDKGVTLLVVSHDANMVRHLCQQALWLEEGQLIAFDEADNVVTAYMEQLAYARARDDQQRETHRWGSREVEITRVEFLDQAGQVVPRFRTGEAFTARMHYRAAKRVEQPMFGVAIHRDDDTYVNGPNTQLASFLIPAIEGTGSVDYCVAELNLL
ncbi:MAG TPA: ABC transporter ATP-binding protein, partial [Anaerolineae bacterium]|nr:ABC transporter ATP-binding protein [Anaerolineae bacterium]